MRKLMNLSIAVLVLFCGIFAHSNTSPQIPAGYQREQMDAVTIYSHFSPVNPETMYRDSSIVQRSELNQRTVLTLKNIEWEYGVRLICTDASISDCRKYRFVVAYSRNDSEYDPAFVELSIMNSKDAMGLEEAQILLRALARQMALSLKDPKVYGTTRDVPEAYADSDEFFEYAYVTIAAPIAVVADTVSLLSDSVKDSNYKNGQQHVAHKINRARVLKNQVVVLNREQMREAEITLGNLIAGPQAFREKFRN